MLLLPSRGHAFIALGVALIAVVIFAGGCFRLSYGFIEVFAQRDAIGLARQLLQHGIVDCELFFCVAGARIGIRHQQRDLVALLSLGKSSKELTARADNSFILPVAVVRLDQPRMQFRTRCGVGKLLIKKRDQLGGA